MIELVIFDMDGVLVDSEEAISQASVEALREWGVEAKISDFVEFAGMGDDKYIGGVANKYGVSYDLAMKDLAYKIYFEKAKERVKVFPWSRPLVETLGKDYKIAVASASDYPKVMKNIECVGVSPADFDVVVTGSDVEKKKPDPSIFLKAAEKAGIAPSDAIVFEDALSGVMAAKAAGMTAIAVTSTFEREKLLESGADYVVDDLIEAIDIISSINEQKE